jgi:hypothetical protein
MFGILSPCRQLLSKTDRAGYTSAYCSLCGFLGHQYGLKARMLVVNYIATLWWLLSPHSAEGQARLRTSNCIRGVGQPRKQSLSDLEKLLAALSVQMVAIKVDDDLSDNGGWRSRLARCIYQGSFQKARRDLAQTGFDLRQLDAFLSSQKTIERDKEDDFKVASEPTARAYGLVAREIARRCSSKFTPEQAAAAGEALGRAVYLVDAIRDSPQDLGTAYNPLCLASHSASSDIPQRLRATVLEFVGSHLSCGRQIAMDVAQHLARSWHAVERTLLASAGVRDEKSVTLYCGCCIPCGNGAIIADEDDCHRCAFGLCCSCCCCAYCLGT